MLRLEDMTLPFGDLRERLSGSLWFIPGLVVLALGVLAVVLVDGSGLLSQQLLERFPRVFGADAESSRSMLATIAGSMVTVAGVTFSVTVVAVGRASTQYTPRILRTFMHDRPSQLALGMLVGVFVYCLVVIRTIRSDLAIPSLAVLAAFVLAVLAIGFLMYFIHHIASSLEAGSVCARVSEETVAAVDHLFPEELGDSSEVAPGRAVTCPEEWEWHPVAARRSGYIQNVAAESLLRTADERSIVLRMEKAIGEFVVEGGRLLSVARVRPDEALCANLNRCFTIDSYRTIRQDPEFGIRIMADIALKALSPGIQDPTTAVVCIDYIGAVLARLAGRRIESAHRLAGAELRVIARGPTFAGALATALEELRTAAADNARVMQRTLEMLQTVSEATRSPPRLQLLQAHAERIRSAQA